MKISRKHFSELEQFVTEHLRDSTAVVLNAHQYGLLPADPQGLSSFDWQLTLDQQQGVLVRLTQCRAVTAGGCRIEIINNDQLSFRTSLNELLMDFKLTATDELRFCVVVSVNPFVRIPMGQPAPEEVPPRHPYTTPEYQLSVVPSQYVNTHSVSSFHLVIGEIVFGEGSLRQVEDYIPPCTSLLSHGALLKWLRQFESLLQSVEADAFEIVSRVKGRPDKKSVLSELVYYLAEKTVFSLAGTLTSLPLMAAQQPPVFLVDAVQRLTKHFNSVIGCLTDKEREELLRYFEQWSDIAPAVLLNALSAGTALTYDHHRVADHLRELHAAWQLIARVFAQLAQLEYIGKTKDGWKSFINENPVLNAPSPGKAEATRWSPFNS